jgi:ABC-type antimicrobial peptide transport system permease subunit
MSIALRTSLPPEQILSTVREIVRQMDSELPLFEVATLTNRFERTLEIRRLYAWVFGAFATVALGLTLGGLYGVLSYAASQRTREIGIRMALGAERHQVIRLVLSRGLLLVGAGAVLGLGAALASGQVLASLLHGVDARDPTTYGAVTVAVLVVAVVASLPPAWRAARLEPMIALRVE